MVDIGDRRQMSYVLDILDNIRHSLTKILLHIFKKSGLT
jgi:hypothetical protein